MRVPILAHRVRSDWAAAGGDLMRRVSIAALLTFNGGFVDSAGYFGLQGLFTAHVTGNFVTLGAAIVFGTHGIIIKTLALPEFIAVIMLARVTGAVLRARGMAPAAVLQLMLGLKVALLFAFFILCVTLGPFADSDSPGALVAGFAGVAAMAVQNAAQRVHLGNLPPTTIMTGNTTQAALDAVDLLHGVDAEHREQVRTRFVRTVAGMVAFATGCAAAAALYVWVGLYCLALPVVVGAATAIFRARD